MSQMEYREVIRDDYGSKHYEVIHRDGATFVYDYGSENFLEKEEVEVLQNKLNKQEGY